MNKKTLLISSIIFIAGIFIGALGGIYHSEKIFAKSLIFYTSTYIMNWTERCYDAYYNEDDKIGLWALTNLAEIQLKQADLFKSEKDIILKDLVFTHTRIALLYK